MKLTLLLLALSLSLNTTAQDLTKKEIRLYERYRAYQQIDSLKRYGVILFRLQSSSTSITALKARDKQELIPKTIKRQELKNKALTQEFSDHFDFCPIHYFYSDELDSIMAGKVQGKLLNDSLQLQAGLKPKLDYAFIGSYSSYEMRHYPLRARWCSWYEAESPPSTLNGYNLKDMQQQAYFGTPFPYREMTAMKWNHALNRMYKKSLKKMDKLLDKPQLKSALEKLDEQAIYNQ